MELHIPLLVLLGVFGSSSAQFYWGACPDVTVKSGFVVENYFGTWYEIARYSPVPFEDDDARCPQAVYSASQDIPGAIDVVNSSIRPDNSTSGVEGIAWIPDPNEPAKLLVKFSWFSPGGRYWVLDTDYNQYSMVHSCYNIFFGLFRAEINWFLSTNRQPDQNTTDAVFAKFEEQGVDLTPFIYANQDGC